MTEKIEAKTEKQVSESGQGHRRDGRRDGPRRERHNRQDRDYGIETIESVTHAFDIPSYCQPSVGGSGRVGGVGFPVGFADSRWATKPTRPDAGTATATAAATATTAATAGGSGVNGGRPNRSKRKRRPCRTFSVRSRSRHRHGCRGRWPGASEFGPPGSRSGPCMNRSGFPPLTYRNPTPFETYLMSAYI